MNRFSKQIVTVALAMAGCAPSMAMAEANSDSGAGPLSADARLNLPVSVTAVVLIPLLLHQQMTKSATAPQLLVLAVMLQAAVVPVFRCVETVDKLPLLKITMVVWADWVPVRVIFPCLKLP